MSENFSISIFNSRIELATRASFILTCFSDRELDLDRLVFLDYALLYAREFGGPLNLHTDLPNKVAEIIRRREIFPGALKLFISKGLILSIANSNGIFFKVSENTPQYVGCLKSEYFKNLWTNLFWLEDNFDLIDSQRIGYIHRSSKKK
ncbi:ABC-three component system middle component 2 [Janthinobacterium lividum]